MAFPEPLPNRKCLKNCVLKRWFKDSGGTTKRKPKGFLFFLSILGPALYCDQELYNNTKHKQRTE